MHHDVSICSDVFKCSSRGYKPRLADDRLFIYSRGLGQVMRQANMLQFLQKARSKPLHEVIKQVGMALESKRGQGGFNEDISFLTLESQ